MNIKQIPQVVAETTIYQRSAEQIWDSEEHREFKNYIAQNPLQGDLIPGTGGLRKIRWQGSGHGKRGGARVIYYVYTENYPIYLLLAYPKNVQVNLSEKEKKILKNIVETIKKELRRKEVDKNG